MRGICDPTRKPCRTIFSSFARILSCRGRDIFLALQNIGYDPGMSFTCALYPLTAGSSSSHTVMMPSWGSMSLATSPNFWSDCTAASCCCLYLLAFYATSHVSFRRSVNWWIHGPQDVWFSHFIELYEAQSRWLMISQCYQHRYQLAFLFYSLLV